MKFPLIDSVIVSGAGVCNLHCPYCYLSNYDMYTDYHRRVMQAWQDGTYVDNIVKIIKNIAYPEKIVTLRILGAETSLGAAVIAPNLLRLKQEFPNLHEVFLATNFSTHIEDLGTLVKSCNDNNISDVLFLLSIDGIDNAASARGHNVPSAVYKANFDKFFKFLTDTPLPNIKKIDLQMRPMISVQTLASLDTQEKNAQYVISYLNFFDDIFKKAQQLPVYTLVQAKLPNITGLATGSSEDGKALALQYDIYKEMAQQYGLAKQFAEEPDAPLWQYNQWLKSDRFYKGGEDLTRPRSTCGYHNIINIRYDGAVVHCDNWINQSDNKGLEKLKEVNYFEYIGEVMNKAGIIENAANLTEQEYTEKYLRKAYTYTGGALLYDSMNLAAAQELALSGQIDQRYLDHPELVKSDFNGHFALRCPARNLDASHFLALGDLGVYRALLNGRCEKEIRDLTEILKTRYEV